MVDPGNVEHLKIKPNPLRPPLKTAIPHLLPIVNRASPKLSGAAERIRRNSGHDGRRTLVVELKLVLVAPDIARIGRKVNWYITDDL